MKKIFFIISVIMFLSNNVYANTQDVQAKYQKEYNVNLSTIILNNNTKTLNLDDYSLEFSTSLTNIEVVVIKVGIEENDYVKQFTKNVDNYYLGFFKDNKKINTSNIKVKIKNNNKVLNIYNNVGNIIDSTNEIITLNNNNYFFTITDKIDNNKDEYEIIDINTLANSLDIIDNKSIVTIYNYKNDLMDNNRPLGTGYKVLVNNSGDIKEYKIIVKGDITGDAIINLNDITRLYHYYKKIEQMDEPFILAGDVANNDIINLNDITKIYHYYKKIISSL